MADKPRFRYIPAPGEFTRQPGPNPDRDPARLFLPLAGIALVSLAGALFSGVEYSQTNSVGWEVALGATGSTAMASGVAAFLSLL